MNYAATENQVGAYKRRLEFKLQFVSAPARARIFNAPKKSPCCAGVFGKLNRRTEINKCRNTHEVSVPSDFGLRIADFGLIVSQSSNPQSAIRNPKSFSPLLRAGFCICCARASAISRKTFGRVLRVCLESKESVI
jgi:hypothetical protein